MKKFLVLFIVATALVSCAGKFGRVLKSKDNEYKLKMAEQYYANKKFDKAQQVYAQIMPYFKGDPRYEDIYYKYAYVAYYQKDYLNAENLFKTYTENFPNSPRAEECEFMRCICYYKQSPKVELDQTNTSKTIALLQAFINMHPQSSRVKEANEIIDKCRAKLELKEYNNALLYYNLGYYKAAAVAFTTLMNSYPDSDKGDSYAYEAIRSDYKYATLSVQDKQAERYEKVLEDVSDFKLRFPESPLMGQVKNFETLSENNIKKIHNEQTTETTGR